MGNPCQILVSRAFRVRDLRIGPSRVFPKETAHPDFFHLPNKTSRLSSYLLTEIVFRHPLLSMSVQTIDAQFTWSGLIYVRFEWSVRGTI